VITIPAGVVVDRAPAREVELYDVARKWLEKDERTPGIHATALLDPRQGWFQAKFPGPLPDRLVTMFMVGKVLHAFILGAHAGHVDVGVTDAGSSHCDLGYDYSPDLFYDGMVREVKTSRSFYEPKSVDDLSFYIEQVLTYMVATETLESELWVLYLNIKDETGRTAPAFRCYSVKVTTEELAAVREEIALATTVLQAALDSTLDEPFRALPLCREWKCGARNCEWYDQCQPEGRYGTDKFDGTGVKRGRKKKS